MFRFRNIMFRYKKVDYLMLDYYDPLLILKHLEAIRNISRNKHLKWLIQKNNKCFLTLHFWGLKLFLWLLKKHKYKFIISFFLLKKIVLMTKLVLVKKVLLLGHIIKWQIDIKWQGRSPKSCHDINFFIIFFSLLMIIYCLMVVKDPFDSKISYVHLQLKFISIYFDSEHYFFRC